MMNVESATPRLHGIAAVEQRLSIGRSGVYKLMASGELRSVKVGRRRLVPESAIQEFIARLQETA